MQVAQVDVEAVFYCNRIAKCLFCIFSTGWDPKPFASNAQRQDTIQLIQIVSSVPAFSPERSNCTADL